MADSDKPKLKYERAHRFHGGRFAISPTMNLAGKRDKPHHKVAADFRSSALKWLGGQALDRASSVMEESPAQRWTVQSGIAEVANRWARRALAERGLDPNAPGLLEQEKQTMLAQHGPEIEKTVKDVMVDPDTGAVDSDSLTRALTQESSVRPLDTAEANQSQYQPGLTRSQMLADATGTAATVLSPVAATAAQGARAYHQAKNTDQPGLDQQGNPIANQYEDPGQLAAIRAANARGRGEDQWVTPETIQQAAQDSRQEIGSAGQGIAGAAGGIFSGMMPGTSALIGAGTAATFGQMPYDRQIERAKQILAKQTAAGEDTSATQQQIEQLGQAREAATTKQLTDTGINVGIGTAATQLARNVPGVAPRLGNIAALYNVGKGAQYAINRFTDPELRAKEDSRARTNTLAEQNEGTAKQWGRLALAPLQVLSGDTEGAGARISSTLGRAHFGFANRANRLYQDTMDEQNTQVMGQAGRRVIRTMLDNDPRYQNLAPEHKQAIEQLAERNTRARQQVEANGGQGDNPLQDLQRLRESPQWKAMPPAEQDYHTRQHQMAYWLGRGNTQAIDRGDLPGVDANGATQYQKGALIQNGMTPQQLHAAHWAAQKPMPAALPAKPAAQPAPVTPVAPVAPAPVSKPIAAPAPAPTTAPHP